MSDIYNFLDEQEKEIYGSLSQHISKLMNEQLALLRKAARKKGIIAQNLADLKSEKGEPFREEKSAGLQWGDGYQKAFAGSGIKMETAYFCKETQLFTNPADEGCGWVKGTPIEKKYNEIGPLSGSAGERFYCRICRQQIGEVITMRS